MRAGLTTVGLPRAPQGLQPEDPTLAELLKPQGYLTAQHGKNHLVDRNEYVPGRQPSNAGVAQVGEGEPTASVSPSAGCGSGNHARAVGTALNGFDSCLGVRVESY